MTPETILFGWALALCVVAGLAGAAVWSLRLELAHTGQHRRPRRAGAHRHDPDAAGWWR